ncbi:MAG: hypothetical protein ABR577_14710 [Pyrinomonadaceae bacterium]
MRRSFIKNITFIIFAACAGIGFDARVVRSQETLSSPATVAGTLPERTTVALPLFAGASAKRLRADNAAIFSYPHGSDSQTSSGGLNGSSLPSLTAGEKFHYGLRQAFYTPGAYVAPAISAGIRRFQEADVPAKTGKDKFADYLSDYARDFGTLSSTEIFGSGIYPILFKQNPTYTPLKRISQGSASNGERFLYAIKRTVVTNGDNGKRQPNYSRFAGDFTGAALANIWERNTASERDRFGVVTDINRRRGVGPTFSRFGFTLGFDALSNVLEEFFGFGR